MYIIIYAKDDVSHYISFYFCSSLYLSTYVDQTKQTTVVRLDKLFC
jgi:hypothetical protein